MRLSSVAQPIYDLISITEADNTSNTYATYDEEMVKRVLIIEPGHAANTT